MIDNLFEDEMVQLNEFISARMGINFTPDRLKNLKRQIIIAAKDSGFPNYETYIKWLMDSPMNREQIEVLANHITIGETYFWREPQVFETLKEKILPDLLTTREKGSKRLRIWSAGCSTGEEPYSIAILLRSLIPDIDDWNIHLLATDINPKILQRASTGVYGNWSFRNVPNGFMEKHFTKTDTGKWEIALEIRKMVTFAYLNLAEDIFPSPMNNTNAMDLIFCRNVLMYFLPERAQEVSQRFFNSLVDGGWFMVGASELSQHLFPHFTSIQFPTAIAYRRETRGGKVQKSQILKQNPKPEFTYKLSIMPLIENNPTSSNIKTDFIPKEKEITKNQDDKQEISLQDATIKIRDLANEGKLTDALVVCEHAIDVERLNPALHYLYAMILQEIGNNEDAVAALKRALYLDPDFILAYYSLGCLKQIQGHYSVSNKNLNNALALLNKLDSSDIVPESDGLTAGRLREIIHATTSIGVDV